MSTIGAGYGASPSQNGNFTIGAGAPDFGNLLGVDGNDTLYHPSKIRDC